MEITYYDRDYLQPPDESSEPTEPEGDLGTCFITHRMDREIRIWYYGVEMEWENGFCDSIIIEENEMKEFCLKIWESK
jgi:hypothetical protein